MDTQAGEILQQTLAGATSAQVLQITSRHRCSQLVVRGAM